jgi:hypothetical protein
LGRDETPFFGVSRKEKREKRRKRTPFFATPGSRLERGRVLREGWPKYYVGLKDGALVVRFGSADSDSIAREKQRLENMGLVEGVHFTVKMPEGGKKGYVSILKRGP